MEKLSLVQGIIAKLNVELRLINDEMDKLHALDITYHDNGDYRGLIVDQLNNKKNDRQVMVVRLQHYSRIEGALASDKVEIPEIEDLKEVLDDLYMEGVTQ